ncbi:putative porin [Paraburkholderia tropica]|uniref:porin n=1 Tax=Paraburkholderia tropica TaxID=92647 RepID=UPI001616FCD1|nr:porin [Paraburkholderia tropica]MBB3000204.1 putative porin [Paraburkholderia tropica]MBB6319835.1 putative porin [Paraburkholderia tropica]
MNKKILIACLGGLSAGAAHAQSSVTLYGLVDTSISYVSNQRTNGANSPGSGGVQMNSGNLSASRWGLRGAEDLGGGMSAIFMLEGGFSSVNGKTSNGGKLFGRQSYVGLRANGYGTFTMGRQYDFILTFVTPLGAAGSGWGGNLAMHPYDNDDSIQNIRINNAVRYTSETYRGFTAGAMYGFSNTAGSFGNNAAYSAGLSYANGPFKAGAAILEINRDGNVANADGAVSSTDGSATITGGDELIWALGARYAFGPHSVGVSWTHSATDDVTGVWQGGSTTALKGNTLIFDNFSIDGRYAVTPSLYLSAAYTYTQARFDAGSRSARPKWNQVVAQIDKVITPRTDVYLEGVFQSVSGGRGNAAFDASVYTLTPSSNSNQVVVAAGLRHRF